jgi:hypothetical protein
MGEAARTYGKTGVARSFGIPHKQTGRLDIISDDRARGDYQGFFRYEGFFAWKM